jgi:hypothetical protein
MFRVGIICVSFLLTLLLLGACAPSPASESHWTEVDRSGVTVPVEQSDEAPKDTLPGATRLPSEHRVILAGEMTVNDSQRSESFFLRSDEAIRIIVESPEPITMADCTSLGGIHLYLMPSQEGERYWDWSEDMDPEFYLVGTLERSDTGWIRSMDFTPGSEFGDHWYQLLFINDGSEPIRCDFKVALI